MSRFDCRTDTPLSPDLPSHEIRIALVLYGGVSLAVYENGVTQSFHDLIRRSRGFDVLLDLLDARAIVDVVSGTSAGGINGLMLAASLESGSSFEGTLDLWRTLADVSALLRRPDAGRDTRSVMDGDGYYFRELAQAFRTLTRDAFSEMVQSPKEIDLFITGTHLQGVDTEFVDSLGTRQIDTIHKAVFHLKHRRGRKLIGVTGTEVDGPFTEARFPRMALASQAEILAAVGRITSAFPGAFPPFRVQQVDPRGKRPDVVHAVDEAISRVRGEVPGKGRAFAADFVDGGILDNRPFGPALRAIFYRMPTGPAVQRKLFYVDPGSFNPSFPRDDQGREPNPLHVLVASAIGIPLHETIVSDIEQLVRHNELVAWYRSQTEAVEESLAPLSTKRGPTFDPARLEALAKSFALREGLSCCAASHATSLHEEELLSRLRNRLESDRTRDWSHLDVAYHFRLVMHLMYRVHAVVARGLPRDAHERHVLVALGRLVKLLRLIDSAVQSRRAVLLREAESNGFPHEDEWDPLRKMAAILTEEHPAWTRIVADLRAVRDRSPGAPVDPCRVADEVIQALSSAHLTHAHAETRRLDVPQDVPGESTTTVLGVVAATCSQLAQGLGAEFERVFHCFAQLDDQMFPIRYAAGIHELDEISFARIHPADATLGVTPKKAESKLAGDEVADFSGFFRKDWRTNDRLWGRLDGASRIVELLLDDAALDRLLQRDQRLASGRRLKSAAGRHGSSFDDALEAWEAMNRDPYSESLREQFREALVLGIQRPIVERDFPRLLADRDEEARRFRRPKPTRPEGADPVEQFENLALGDEKISWKEPGGVPRRQLAGLMSQSAVVGLEVLRTGLDVRSLLRALWRAFVRFPVQVLGFVLRVLGFLPSWRR